MPSLKTTESEESIFRSLSKLSEDPKKDLNLNLGKPYFSQPKLKKKKNLVHVHSNLFLETPDTTFQISLPIKFFLFPVDIKLMIG